MEKNEEGIFITMVFALCAVLRLNPSCTPSEIALGLRGSGLVDDRKWEQFKNLSLAY